MPKVKAVDKPNKEETEALADVDQNKEAPKRGRGRPKKSGEEEESTVKEAEAGPVDEIENEDLAKHDQIKEVPKKGWTGEAKEKQAMTRLHTAWLVYSVSVVASQSFWTSSPRSPALETRH